MPGFGPFDFCQASQHLHSWRWKKTRATTEHQQTEVFYRHVGASADAVGPIRPQWQEQEENPEAVLLSKDLGADSRSFAKSIENINDRCDIRREAAHGQVDEAI